MKKKSRNGINWKSAISVAMVMMMNMRIVVAILAFVWNYLFVSGFLPSQYETEQQ